MSSKRPLLKHKDVIRALKYLGFRSRKTKATSHEHWVREDRRGFFKVTVDKHISPYSIMLIKSMASQAGVKVKDFYEVCKNNFSLLYVPSYLQ